MFTCSLTLALYGAKSASWSGLSDMSNDDCNGICLLSFLDLDPHLEEECLADEKLLKIKVWRLSFRSEDLNKIPFVKQMKEGWISDLNCMPVPKG